MNKPFPVVGYRGRREGAYKDFNAQEITRLYGLVAKRASSVAVLVLCSNLGVASFFFSLYNVLYIVTSVSLARYTAVHCTYSVYPVYYSVLQCTPVCRCYFKVRFCREQLGLLP